MFITFNFKKNKSVVAFLLIVVLGVVFSYVASKQVQATTEGKINYTIVVDAGHGGIDNGCSGVNTKITESEINLNVAKGLKNLLMAFGFNVVLTRENSEGLYSQLAKNKKQNDMQKRKEIIEKSKANMVVSIHMNSFPNKYEHGAQAFFQRGSEKGELLATAIQEQMQKNLTNAREVCCGADLYILQCTQNPSVVVEGGFLSNPEEEMLLADPQYQQKIAYSIFCGIIKFYEKSSTI